MACWGSNVVSLCRPQCMYTTEVSQGSVNSFAFIISSSPAFMYEKEGTMVLHYLK